MDEWSPKGALRVCREGRGAGRGDWVHQGTGDLAGPSQAGWGWRGQWAEAGATQEGRRSRAGCAQDCPPEGGHRGLGGRGVWAEAGVTRLQWVSRLGCPELGGREPLDSATRGSREGHRAGLHAQGWWETNSELVSGAGSAGERVLSWVHTPTPVHNAPPSSTVSPIILDPTSSRQLPPTTLPQWAWAAWPPLGTPLETPRGQSSAPGQA